MENILNKALKEVLTPKYSEELRDSYDTGYTPTESFENSMRGLIRKTDRPPIFRYTRYIAAAAAIMIAVGAAVLVPVLMNRDIETTEPETAETSTGLPSITLEIDTGENTTFTTTADTLEAITFPSSVSEDTTVQLSDTAPSETTSEDPTADTGTEVSGTTPANSGTDDGDTNNDIVVPGDDDADVHSGTGSDLVEDGSDDDVAIDDDDDDLCVLGDDDAVAPDSVKHIDVSDGDRLSEVLSKNFGGTSFDALYAVSGNYRPGNELSVPVNFSNTEYTFIQEFVHKLGNAKTNNTHIDGETYPYIQLRISDRIPRITDSTANYRNYSAWLNYDMYFKAEGDTDEEPDDDDEEDQLDDDDDFVENLSFTVRVYKDTGRVAFVGNIGYVDPAAKKYELYNIASDFYMEPDDVKRLFESMNGILMPTDAAVLSDISSALGITADNIAKTTHAYVNSVYDTNLTHAKADTEYLTGLFSGYAGRKLEKTSNFNTSASIRFYVVTKTGACLDIAIEYDGYVYLHDYGSVYRFRYDKGEPDKALDAIAAANNIGRIKRYGTLAEYLSDKNFTKITKISLWDEYVLTDEDALKKFTKMLKAEFKNSRLITDRNELSKIPTTGIMIHIDGWRAVIVLQEDALMIRTTSTDIFSLSDGFSKKFREMFLSDKATQVINNIREGADDIDTDEEDVYNDPPDDLPITDDQNPIT